MIDVGGPSSQKLCATLEKMVLSYTRKQVKVDRLSIFLERTILIHKVVV